MWQFGGGEPVQEPQAQAQLCFLPAPSAHPGRPFGDPSSLGQAAGCRLEPTGRVWGSALRRPLSLSRGGLYFILFVGRLGLLSGFNDLCRYL